jgi:membrane glycosyltransferase
LIKACTDKSKQKAQQPNADMTLDNFKVVQNRTLIGVLIGCVVILLAFVVVLSIIGANQQEGSDNGLYFALVLLCCVVVFAVVFCCLSMRFKIVVHGDSIVYTPMIGKTKEYSFADITNVQTKDAGRVISYAVHFNNQIKPSITIDLLMKGSTLFEERLRMLNKI